MKNIKVSMKLTLGFACVLLMTAIIGTVSIYSLQKLSAANEEMYYGETEPLGIYASLIDYIQRARIGMRNLAMSDGDMAKIKSLENEMRTITDYLSVCIAEYEATIVGKEELQVFNDAVKIYEAVFLPILDIVEQGAKNGVDQVTLLAQISERTEDSTKMLSYFDECLELRMEQAKKTIDENIAQARLINVLIIAVLVVSCITGVIMALYLSGSISKPISVLAGFLTNYAANGDLSLTKDDEENIKGATDDEIGKCIKGAVAFRGRLLELDENLGKIAGGDLTVDFKPLSDKDNIGNAVVSMVGSLNNMFRELRISSSQVSSGAGQIAQGAQMLASGSTEQAASIEEFLAAIRMLEEQTRNNADNSGRAKIANDLAGSQLNECIKSMERMLESMKEIDESSQKITKVIRVIEDIAFQTNILAINASVEAAHAGQQGRGFAVVAEEVRSLAGKSAEAAKETALLIEGSSIKVNEGSKIVEQTNNSIKKVVEYAGDVTNIVDNVAEATAEQSKAIKEISLNIGHISDVVQQNSATAEESAAAAEEMSAQSTNLNDMVASFKLSQTTETVSGDGTPGEVGLALKTKTTFGKY